MKPVTKRLSVVVTGTKAQVYQCELLLKMVQDMMKLGLEPIPAMKSVIALIEKD